MLHIENGLTTREISRLAELSQRTIQVGLKAAKEFLERTSNLDWLELVMGPVADPNCSHPNKVSTGKVAYCLRCGWASDPNDRRLFGEKPKLHSEATETAKKVQPKGAGQVQTNDPDKEKENKALGWPSVIHYGPMPSFRSDDSEEVLVHVEVSLTRLISWAVIFLAVIGTVATIAVINLGK